MIYVITQGKYSDYNIICYLQSPIPQDMDILLKEFKTLYGYPDRNDEIYEGKNWNQISYGQFIEASELAGKFIQKDYPTAFPEYLSEDSYGNIDYINQAFILWLKQQRGFTDFEDIEEYQLED